MFFDLTKILRKSHIMRTYILNFFSLLFIDTVLLTAEFVSFSPFLHGRTSKRCFGTYALVARPKLKLVAFSILEAWGPERMKALASWRPPLGVAYNSLGRILIMQKSQVTTVIYRLCEDAARGAQRFWTVLRAISLQ